MCRGSNKKLPKSKNFGSFLLHQHPNWIFKEARKRLHKLRSLGAVADAMVNGDGGFHVSAGSFFLL